MVAGTGMGPDCVVPPCQRGRSFSSAVSSQALTKCGAPPAGTATAAAAAASTPGLTGVCDFMRSSGDSCGSSVHLAARFPEEDTEIPWAAVPGSWALKDGPESQRTDSHWLVSEV